MANQDALPTGTVTFLFSDIEGSTLMVRRLGEAWASVLSRQRVLCRAAWNGHGGHELGTEGDSFFVVFASASQAVAAAIASQRAIADESWPENGDVRIRVGLHTGAAHRHDEGYVGINVHIGARVASTAHGGQVVLSAATADAAREDLHDGGVSLVDLGEHALKDIPGKLRLFQAWAQGLREEFPPLRSRGGPGHLPSMLTPTIGRERDLATIGALLDRGARLVTLTGPGGSGKTRLSLALAHQLTVRPADGVHVVPLASVTTGAQVLEEVSRVLALPDDSDLLEYLESRELVLVLDNLEQIPDAAEPVTAILERAPRAVVVATTRRALHAPGEHEYPVPPLSLPDIEGTGPEVARSAAVRLFCDLAGRTRPGFRLTTANSSDIAALCAAVDGLPLGIEILAARTKLLSPAALRTRLDRVADLAHTDGTRTSRQQTLRATVGWSYDLLSPDAQTVLDVLGVFAGTASLDALVAVVGFADIALQGDVVEALFELVDASLVRGGEDDEGEPNFALLVTVQGFAREQLEAKRSWTVVEAAHGQYYYNLVAALPDKYIDGRSSKPALDRHAAELDAVVQRLPAVHDPDWYGERVVPSLHLAALLAGSAADAERLATVQRWVTSVITADSPADAAGRAAMLSAGGSTTQDPALGRSWLVEAERLCGELLALNPRPHLPRWVDPGLIAADVLSARTQLELGAGDLDAAAAAVDRLRALENVRDDLRVRRLVQFSAWWVARARGDLADAREHLQVLADIAVNARARAIAAFGLAELDLEEGRHQAAQRRLAGQLQDVTSGVDTWLLVGVARVLARAVAAKHPDLATRTWNACAARLEAEGIPDDEDAQPPAGQDLTAGQHGRTEQVEELLVELAALPPVADTWAQ